MNTITNFILDNGLIAMFIIILLEYACFPVSSEIVLPFSGAVACLQNISYFVIVPTSVIAGLLGTSICYFLGRIGGTSLLDFLMRKFPKSKAPILSSLEKFEKYGTLAVCMGRVIPLCRTYIAFIAGSSKQTYSVFLGSSFLGITVWNCLLIGLGYLLGKQWYLVGLYYEKYKHIILISLGIILVSVVMHNILKRKCQ